ncbi:tartrate dehydrogenase [Halococcus salifodinae]|uniref:tartrate dehydrogenase n=1 Tax=Halococcus salifodinae TaxID=36738 RepID=UPI000677CAC2|nr:tartrate dehydrogenase [Halococcus salifodinae]
MPYEVALLPGDGIGPAVVDAALPVFEAVADRHGFTLETTVFDWGSERYHSKGTMMPDDGLDQLEGYDAILLGAVGDPSVPDHVTLNGLLIPIRKGFEQYVCKRPATLFAGIESPIQNHTDDIDFVVYRENTEGEYSDIGGREHRGTDAELAVQSAVFTRTGTERIVRQAFEAATAREGKLTSVTKSNAQAHGMVFWDDIVNEVHEEFPEVEVERLLVDAASMDLIRRPEAFDVLVASNLFGDILTDIGAVVSGGMGLAPSGNINPTMEYPSMFEPVHGSAPDIVGQEIANPIATVRSGAMLFEHLGESSAAETLRTVVENHLADAAAPRTPDLGGAASTTDVTEALEERIE